MPRRVRTPNCTHVDMDRIYGRDQQCYVCGREPSIGFLYECRQDCNSPSLQDLLSSQEKEGIVRPKSPLRSELEDIGLSESIIRTAEQGHYTPAQLDVLKTQKQELKQIIEDSVQGRQINDVVAKLAAFATAPSNNDGAMNSKGKDTSATCAFRACHTCRPYYRDRVFISFAAVVSADFPPISREDVQHLPTKSARVMCSIGVSHNSSTTRIGHDEPPFTAQTTITFATSTDAPHTASTTTSESSELTFKTTQTDVDELRALRRPRRRFYNIGHRSSGEIARDLSRIPPLLSRQGLKFAIQGIFHQGRDSSSSGSMITLPVPRTGTVRDSSAARPVGDFDIGALRRVRRQKERNELRNGTYVGGFEDVGTTPHTAKQGTAHSPHASDGEGSCSSESDFSVYSCISEGSEVEVEGGVALTEEAVESHTPDILAVDVPASKSEADVGLQSIMAQV
ncbi:hypothetical protein BU25DRAFT_427760 [Macroventuria anomochaeta]|uniref:Uncharacterized protein n=1 Tax=Macroventuria anomochaeta TaxID=301207 RepID=A0ACB6SI72_9PLEO|nr:uncharacterized protein BU25DRAFT_427760 [Macroventuria anomochaeta]KAF2632984.1 hypothetical protein BU25DRAFT_427760 [Macroventuria anomochaeta]